MWTGGCLHNCTTRSLFIPPPSLSLLQCRVPWEVTLTKRRNNACPASWARTKASLAKCSARCVRRSQAAKAWPCPRAPDPRPSARRDALPASTTTTRRVCAGAAATVSISHPRAVSSVCFAASARPRGPRKQCPKRWDTHDNNDTIIMMMIAVCSRDVGWIHRITTVCNPRVIVLNPQECRDECADGMHLGVDGECEPCPRGTYRTQGVEPACQQCPAGRTTKQSGASSVEDCSLPICLPGLCNIIY